MTDCIQMMEHPPMEAYENLANAIICSAADDYRKALRYSDEESQKSLEDFFYSGWFNILTDVEPKKLLSMLRDEHRAKAKIHKH